MKIHELELFISNYEETVSFYKNTMQFQPLREGADSTSFQTGESVFTLHKDETHAYYYHFAFNIPPNLFQSAKDWVAAKIPLSLEVGQDEVSFTASKAKSFYFEDPAGNIVEYIARSETTTEAAQQHFKAGHIVNISEIGLTAQDVNTCVEEILNLSIPVKHNEVISNESLNFMGEYEDGAFILVGPVGRRWIFSDKLAIEAPVIITTNRGTIKNY
ncbi:VOC family protein [Lysinibacillus sp. 54212]|uniref:VOC family protein n=1 Tax=Lysinibacillus sp. 54212 TaxID=3119829 RepID=UPI002FC59596